LALGHDERPVGREVETVIEGIGTRARVSVAWVFVMLNMVFVDILSFMSPGALQQIMSGRAEQIELTPEFLLVAAIVAEVPIAMVLLSLVLQPRIARVANIAAAALTIAYVVIGGSATPHYVFMASMETLGCVLIAWWSWTWREASRPVPARALAA
jgi:hypothetical protein